MASITDSTPLQQDITLKAVMEPKTYTVTINSNNGTGQTRTYPVKFGSNFVLPSCPFSAQPRYAFTNYKLNSSYYSVGNSISITGDITIMCQWDLISLSGSEVRFRYWLCNGADIAHMLYSYDPALEGLKFNMRFVAGGMIYTTHIILTSSEIQNKHVPMAGLTFSGTGSLDCWLEDYPEETLPETDVHGEVITYVV